LATGPISPMGAPSPFASVAVVHAAWRSALIEGRLASLRTQCTALLAVAAVILGIGATSLGALGSRRLSTEMTIVVIAFAAVAVLFLIFAVAILLSTAGMSAPTRAFDPVNDVLLHGEDPAAASAASETEIEAVSEYAQRMSDIATKRMARAIWLLGVGIVAAIVLAAILTVVPTQPTKNELVSGSTVSVRRAPNQ
jgi:amino acid transporter